MPFLFAGERPSARAQQLGASWRRGGQAATTLHKALRACGIDPMAQRYTNVFVCATGGISRWSLWRIRVWGARGYTVVALGKKVHRVLDDNSIAHLALRHPAARGMHDRRTCAYQAHVAQVLGATHASHQNQAAQGVVPPL